MNIPIPPSILKKTSAYANAPAMPTLAPNKEPPGVPPFPPSDLSSDDEDSVENVRESNKSNQRIINVNYKVLISTISFEVHIKILKKMHG